MKQILVVSDNPRLVKFFREECNSQKIYNIANVEYKYSSVNKNSFEMMDLGLTPINIKDKEAIDFIKSNYSIVLSLHCKQIFPPELVSSVTCINVHPGLNPYNRGWYPQVFSIINGKPIGATIHLMDGDVDHGKIVDQIGVDIKLSDTSLDVYERVFQAEIILIRRALLKIISNEIEGVEPAFEGNYNTIQDFKSLCHLDLEAVAPLGEHINLLRALSHGTFKNAYFINEQGKKVFIRVSLEEEGC